MKYILTETQLKLLVEQSNGLSAASCDKSISKSAGYLENWKNMDENKRKELLKSIRSSIEQALSRSKEEYIKWFQHPTTIQKFRTPKEREVLKKLPSYLQTINKIKLSFKGPDSFPNAIAWVQYSADPTLVNYNISQIHDGTDFQGDSLETTTKHEIGHLIDSFFQKNGVKTYNQTIDTSTPESHQANYIVNDRDQYARLNVFRGIVGAGPNDHPSTLLNKFMEQVKNGKITSNKFDFSPVVSKTPALTKKNDTPTTTEINKLLKYNIIVDGKPENNMSQLFSNYATERGGTVYIGFDLLSQFNLTAKDLDKKYYTLKMTPK
jgi:hypothetical protein